MALIDDHRFFFDVKCRALFHPGAVAPADRGKIRDHGSRARAEFHAVSEGIRLIESLVFRTDDKVLVKHAGHDAGDEGLPHADLVAAFYFIGLRIPSVEIPDDRHALRIRRPYSEPGALLTVYGRRMRTELRVKVIMRGMTEIVLIHFSEFILVSHKDSPLICLRPGSSFFQCVPLYL